MPALPKAALDEFAFRLAHWDSEGWLVLVTEREISPSDTAIRVVSMLQALGSAGASLITVTSADALIRLARDHATQGSQMVTCGYEQFTAETWIQVDLARSALQVAAPVAMIMSTDSFALMLEAAPNFASWVGSCWAGVGTLQLNDKERASRLARLRQRYRKTDEEVIALAKSATGSIEPDFVEWLILLREDGVLGSS